MRSSIAQQKFRDKFEVAKERADGREPSLMLFTSMSAADVNIPDISKLPSVENNTILQDEDGNFYFTLDYSAFDGPDLLA